MAWLLLGMAIGMTAVSLNEMERERYYQRRAYMDFLGVFNNSEVYRDRSGRQYYVEHGDDVRRVGPPNFKAHPVYTRRLKEFFEKHNPDNIRWVDFILASYYQNESACWEDLKKKYLYPRKPDEPTWGRGIRKQRWAEYDAQLAAYEEATKKIDAEYKKECQYWDKEYNDYVPEVVDTRQILVRALSGANINAPVIVAVAPPPTDPLFQAVVPQGKKPGDQFDVEANGMHLMVTVPPGVRAGEVIQFAAPKPVATVTAVLPKANPPPPAIRSNSSTAEAGWAPAPTYFTQTYGNQATSPPPPSSSSSSSGAPPPSSSSSSSGAPPPAIF